MWSDIVLRAKTVTAIVVVNFRVQGLFHPVISGNIMERCHVDVTGPHRRTARGSIISLTCVDAFSEWAKAFPIPNKEAKTIARVLVEQVF